MQPPVNTQEFPTGATQVVHRSPWFSAAETGPFSRRSTTGLQVRALLLWKPEAQCVQRRGRRCIGSAMLAAWYEAKGAARDVLRYGELPDPSPGPGEVRVWVHASGVNPTDVKARSGRPGSTALQFARVIPHHDGAGVVDQVGEGVSPARLGQRVWIYEAQWRRPSGTAAQYVVVPEIQAVPLPDGVEFAEGACLGIAAITAHQCLLGDGPIAGKTVLVQGAAGAVGYHAAQLARLAHARVLATIGSKAQEHLLREVGIDELIDRKAEDAGERALRLTNGSGVDRIVEVALGANLDADLKALAPGGTIAAYASDGDPGLPLPFRQL